MHEFLFTFQNTHQALKGEKRLKALGREVKLIPTPFEIFAECGFSLKIRCSEDILESVKNDDKWSFAECYLILKKNGSTQRYEKI